MTSNASQMALAPWSPSHPHPVQLLHATLGVSGDSCEGMIHAWPLLSASWKDAVVICTLGTGTSFGESILDNTPRHATIVTREFTELLRIEQREFRALWEVSPSVCSLSEVWMKGPKSVHSSQSTVWTH